MDYGGYCRVETCYQGLVSVNGNNRNMFVCCFSPGNKLTLRDGSAQTDLMCCHAETKVADQSHVHPRRRNVTTSVVGLKTVTYVNISPKNGEPQR